MTRRQRTTREGRRKGGREGELVVVEEG